MQQDFGVLSPVGESGTITAGFSAREPAPPMPKGQLKLEAIPEAQRPQPVQLTRIAMPFLMIVAVLGMVALMVLGGGGRSLNPMMLMFPVMMLMSVAMMFGGAGGGAQDPDETRRTYLRHLAAVRQAAVDNARAQRAHELHTHPEPLSWLMLAQGHRLFERGVHDADVLEVRVGTGRVRLCTPLVVPDPGAAEDLDPVCAVSVRHAVRSLSTVAGMPIVISLQAFPRISITGPRAHDLARALLMQLACAHGPQVVGVSAAGVGTAREPWEWLKWLPHNRAPGTAAYRLCVVDEKAAHSATHATTMLGAVQPEDVTHVLEVGWCSAMTAEEGLILDAGAELTVATESGAEVLGQPDGLALADAVLLARHLTRHARWGGTGDVGAPGSNDIVELNGYRDIDDVRANLWTRPRERLKIPVGVDEHGRPVEVDIKEAAQGGTGPHGLCLGATGSGKSELLKTLVVSLALSHPPELVNFVLVDFKGGATFLGCEDLPHTAAVITNLEEEALLVDRFHDAIAGEMNRRQELLRAAGNFANVDEYNAAMDTPLPALLIIVDEFSELLGQHPEFAELFVAVGRLGRSLHVHLLLASQRLEEGRLRGLDSHLSYRFGLKTFSAAESRQVLGVTDAYELPSQPGAGYLKTTTPGLQRFQASYVSGKVRRRVGETARAQVRVFDGWTVEEATYVEEDTSLFDVVVNTAAQATNVRAHRLWLPPLPAAIELHAVEAGAVGLIDRPYHQRQDPMSIDFGEAGGHVAVCGGPQSGKSHAVRTLVAAAALTASPKELHCYVIDLGGGALGSLTLLPHVVAVADRHHPERVRRIVDEVLARIEDFTAEAEAAPGAESGMGPGAETRNDEQPVRVLLVVDGWHHVGTTAAEFEDLGEKLTTIAADGPSADVHLIATTTRWTSMRPAIRDLIAHRVELKLTEPMDSLIDRKAQEKVPAAPGRGLTKEGEPMLIARTSNQDLAHIASLYPEQHAPALQELPTTLSLSELRALAGPAASGEYPHPPLWLGIGGPRLRPQSYSEQALLIIGNASSGKSSLVSTLLAQIVERPREDVRIVLIDPRRTHLGEVPDSHVAAYATTDAGATVEAAATTLRQRLPGPDITPEQLKQRNWWTGPDIVVCIDDAELVPDAALHPLLALIPHAHDIGLHLIVARKAGGIGRALYGGLMAAVKDTQPAVVLLDADKDEGAIFGVKPSPQPAGRGHLIRKATNCGLIRLAQPAESIDPISET